jgi:antibiotic biosynthesis monooxygenase (ABM) superfamily enzyme
MIISDSLDFISVNRAAELLGVSRSGFYKWFQCSVSPDNDPNLEIRVMEEIQNIVIEFPGYGYRRVTIELQNRGHSVKKKIVRKFMKEDNPLCVKRRFKLG